MKIYFSGMKIYFSFMQIHFAQDFVYRSGVKIDCADAKVDLSDDKTDRSNMKVDRSGMTELTSACDSPYCARKIDRGFFVSTSRLERAPTAATRRAVAATPRALRVGAKVQPMSKT